MATIHKQFKINAPIDQVWAKMSDLPNVHKLFGMLANAELNGDTRVCRTQDGGELKELMVSVDPDQKRLVYAIIESPFNFEFHSASCQAIADGDDAIFEWYTDLKPDEMAETIEQVIESERENYSGTDRIVLLTRTMATEPDLHTFSVGQNGEQLYTTWPKSERLT